MIGRGNLGTNDQIDEGDILVDLTCDGRGGELVTAREHESRYAFLCQPFGFGKQSFGMTRQSIGAKQPANGGDTIAR